MSEEKVLPKGWKIAILEDLLDYIQPTEFIVTSTEYDDNYKTPVLTAGKSFLLGYTNETFGIFTKLPAIIFDDFTTAIKWVNFPFKVKSSAMKILVPTHQDVNMKYVYYFMETLRINTDTHKRYWISVGAKTNIPLPPLPEQHRIVAKIEELFSSLDKGIESLKTAQQQLKVYRQAVLKHAFEGKLTVKWRQQQEMGARLPAGRFEGRFTNKDIKEGKLPEGWVWKTIEDVCNMKAGFFVKASDIKENFEDGLFPCYGGNGLRGYVKSITHDGTFVLVGRQGALCGNVHLVKGKFHATEHALVTKAKENVDIQWLYYKLISMKLNQYSSGVAQPGLSVNKLLPIELSVPTLPEQHHIVSEIEKRLSVADKLEESIATALQQAEALRQSILKKAFEGRLLSEAELNECRKDPNWEPASVLLERIKKERETQTNSVKKKSVKTKKSTKSKNLNQSKNE
ncbi:restriction endonuclease subunit S [Raineya sp.]|jgi:type I restriction enzyme S subunit